MKTAKDLLHESGYWEKIPDNNLDKKVLIEFAEEYAEYVHAEKIKGVKQLLIDCANFIQPYNDGGNEAERLVIRLDEFLKNKLTK